MIGKCRLRGLVRLNRSRISRMGDRITLVVALLHFVYRANRQIVDGDPLSVLEFDGAVIAELTRFRSGVLIIPCQRPAVLAQRDRKGKLFFRVSAIAGNGFADRQVRAGILAVDKVRPCGLSGGDLSRDHPVGGTHVPAGLRCLCHGKTRSGRQPLNDDCIIVVQCDGAAALDLTHFVLAPEIVEFSIQRISGGVGKGNGEGEIPCIITRLQAAALQLLADAQVTGLPGSVRLFVRHHHHVQQAEQAGEIQISQIILVGVRLCAFILRDRAGQRGIVLPHPCADKALIRDKEGLNMGLLSGSRTLISCDVHIVKAIIHAVFRNKVHSIMQVHRPENNGSSGIFQSLVLPTVKCEAAGGLDLHGGHDVPKRDVHIVVHGVLVHGLGQDANAGHDRDAVIRRSRVGVNGVDAHNDGNHGGIDRIPGGSAGLPEIICCIRRGVGPCHLGVAEAAAAPGREDQKTVVIRCTGRDHVRARMISEQRERSAGKGPSVLIHLLDPQLPLLIGDVNQGPEVPVELVHIQEAESQIASGAGYLDIHNVRQGLLRTIFSHILA